MDAYLQQDVAGQLARVEETLGISQQKQEEVRKQLGVRRPSSGLCLCLCAFGIVLQHDRLGCVVVC